MLIGLAAMPANFLWDRIARRIGVLNALVAAYLMQILGIAATLVSDTLAGALIGALLFGGTFVGIVGLVLTMAGRYYPRYPSKDDGKNDAFLQHCTNLGPGIDRSDYRHQRRLYLWLGAGDCRYGSRLWPGPRVEIHRNKSALTLRYPHESVSLALTLQRL